MILTAAGLVLLVFGVEILMAIPGPDDGFRNPDRRPVPVGGDGKPITYLVMGDSTAAGQGGPYAQGIAMKTAEYLARSRPVSLVNLGISGATLDDVAREQLPHAAGVDAAVILLAVGANDATHFTSGSDIRSRLTHILTTLQAQHPGAPIILTGSPDLGTARRFAQPLRWFAGTQTQRVNRIMEPIAREHGVIWAPIARDTGPLFAKDPGLLAPDRFHPNEKGYAVWLPTLYAALDKAAPPRR